ncbi:MAG: hypothetical protein H7Y01_10430, partial [Ferruginibacter sp.]|nr:hypothetical protein [Chitinophagaceae bacterium]
MFKQYLFWILLLSSLRATTQDLLNSGLTQGRFKVGFTVVHSVDLARPAFNNGQHHSKSSPGREMRLAIWYPAATAGTTPMLYKQYVELLLPARNDPAPLRKVFFQSVAELSGDTSLFTNIYAKLIHSKTWSYRDAGIAKGIFPLVIYPGQAHVQSILCEWLASCGFVVVSPAIKGTYSEPAEYNLQGIE